MRIEPDHARTLIAKLVDDATAPALIVHNAGASLPELGSFFAAYNSCVEAFMARATEHCSRAESLAATALRNLETIENTDASLATSLESL